MKLRGPADPNAFRRYDQWKRRIYFDNLPACDVAPAWDGEVFAVTTFKGAWAKEYTKKLSSGELVKLDALRAAKFVLDHPETLKLKRAQAEATIAKSADHDLKEAGDRGTDVHYIMEDLAAGRDPARRLPALRADALEYRPACEKFLADFAPQFLYTEVVGINRTLGFGGTVDLYAEVLGGLRSIDWKSRGEGSQHGAYDNEAAQVGGAYTHFEYLIIEVDGQPQRIPMPDLVGGLIVSLKTDGYEVYPVDMDKAWESFQAMHEGYMLKLRGQRIGRESIGRVLRPPKAQSPELVALRARIAGLTDGQRTQLRTVWPSDINLKKMTGLSEPQRLHLNALVDGMDYLTNVA